MDDLTVGKWLWYTGAKAQLCSMPLRTQEKGEYFKLVNQSAFAAWNCRGMRELGGIAESQGISGLTIEWFKEQRGKLILQGWTADDIDTMTVLEFARDVAKLYVTPTAPGDPNQQTETDGKTKGSKPGRRAAFSPEDDKNLAEDWKAAKANNSTRAEFARGRGIDLKVVVKTLARVRNRKNRDK